MEWIRNNQRAVGMLVVVAVLGGVWLVYFSGLGRNQEMIAVHRYLPARDRLVVNLDRDYRLRTVTVTDDAGEQVWRLERGTPEGKDEELEPEDTIVIGRRVRGMTKVSEGRARLEPGSSYLVTIEADGAEVTVEVAIPSE